MKKLLGVAALLVAAAVLVPVALAAPVNLGSETLFGGGPGGSEWDVQNEGGTSNGLPAGGDDDDSPGLNIHDAQFTGGQSDAFDHGLMVFVDDVIFVAPGGDADLTGETLTAGPVTLSDLDVSMEYFALSSEAKLRTFVTFDNPSGSPIAATVSWVTNMGSDDDTAVAGTSSGDALFTTSDRWVVTFEDCCDPLDNDPVNTHVLFGPGSPAVTPSSVSQTVFENSGTEGILAEYDITVPAGGTRYLLFFN
ncbi:MAG: hypothetical protein IIA23_01570, partial [Chloroflexi bacterium]|nr:hypothetical protein [Chloroflexota bacterium]